VTEILRDLDERVARDPGGSTPREVGRVEDAVAHDKMFSPEPSAM
jgi:hypothetical protein